MKTERMTLLISPADKAAISARNLALIFLRDNHSQAVHRIVERNLAR